MENIHITSLAQTFVDNAIVKECEGIENMDNLEIAQIFVLQRKIQDSIFQDLTSFNFNEAYNFNKAFEVVYQKRAKELMDNDGLTLNKERYRHNYLVRICFQLLNEVSFIKDNELAIQEHVQAIVKKEQYERVAIVKFNGHSLRSIDHTDVYWTGWECDNIAWVVNLDNKNTLLTTNHGDVQITDKKFLEGKIKEYEEAIANSKRLLNLLED